MIKVKNKAQNEIDSLKRKKSKSPLKIQKEANRSISLEKVNKQVEDLNQKVFTLESYKVKSE